MERTSIMLKIRRCEHTFFKLMRGVFGGITPVILNFSAPLNETSSQLSTQLNNFRLDINQH